MGANESLLIQRVRTPFRRFRYGFMGGEEGDKVSLEVSECENIDAVSTHPSPPSQDPYTGGIPFQQEFTTCLSELPDVAPPLGLVRGENGSLRCNGRPTAIQADSGSSCSSKGDSSAEGAKGGMEIRMKRWCLGLGVCLLFSALGVGLGVPLALSAGGPMTHQQRLEAVRRILKEVPLMDGHNDLPWNIRKFVHNQIASFNFSADLMKVDPWARSNWSHTDLPRLRQGMVGGQFWSAYVPCGAQYLDAVQLTLEQIDLIKRLADLHPEHLQIVTSVKGVQDVHRAGKIASLIGVEGGHSLGNSLAILRTFYSLGARYMTLTHACDTVWADCSLGRDEGVETQQEESPATPRSQSSSSGSDRRGSRRPLPTTPAPPPMPYTEPPVRPNGLTDFGKLIVREMNRLGMMIDLSHASVKTIKDVIHLSKAPVIFSHSSAYSVCNNSRNVPDDILKLVALNGGIVMVNFYPFFISCNNSATIADVIAHVNHIRDVAGIDHVGIGAGYDGINFTPSGLEDVSKYPQLLARLMEDPKWTEDDIKKFAGENMLRVFGEVEEVREKWRLAAVMPGEEQISQIYLKGHTECMYLGS